MNRHLSLITAVLLALLLPVPLKAWETDAYTQNSVLSSGRWMKVRVPSDGLYFISASTLRSWGFGDLSRVRVCGYGGRRLPLSLSRASYIDDLPDAAVFTSSAGIVFYGVGGGQWADDGSYFLQNDYSSYGYYYIGERSEGEPAAVPSVDVSAAADNPATTFTERVHYERELVCSPGESGPLLLGEEFRITTSRSFSVATPGMTEGSARIHCSFVYDIPAGASLNLSLNGQSAQSGIRIEAGKLGQYSFANYTVGYKDFPSPDARENSEVRITLAPNGAVNNAWLNFFTLHYRRRLEIPSSGSLIFRVSGPFAVRNVGQGATLLDVSDPYNVKILNGRLADGTLTASTGGNREYAIWNQDASLPSPAPVGFVSAQNLHADSDYDMIIVAPYAFRQQAERLAEMHRTSADTLRVKVVQPEQIYNEFSSGASDPGAFRRYFKMLYDRSGAGIGRRLRYAILMGRTSVDIRGLSIQAPSYPVIPAWFPPQQRASLNESDGFCTDDVTAMLEDGSGANLGNARLSIAIGRIPVVSADEATRIVDKAIQYARGARKTAWKHRFLFLADDENKGDHLTQTEAMINACVSTGRQQHMIRKVYVDAYPLVNSAAPGAREDLYRYLDEGVVWWNYVGHANLTSWTSENIMTYTDLSNMYLRHWPFIYAATCSFLKLDGSAISGGEILYKERFGGAIGIISAVRPVFIPANGMLTAAMGRALAQRDAEGRFLPPGEIYRRAKNDIRTADTPTAPGVPTSDTNRLRFMFVGDPALHLATPSNIVRLDSIGDKSVTQDADSELPVMKALAQVPLSGSVTGPDGTPLTDFNGVVLVEIFDAERSITTLGHGKDGVPSTYEDYGGRVFCGSARVSGGHFSLTAAMPLELAQNFRPATMSLFAYSTEDDTEAVGLCRDFYLYGYDESVPDDNNAPEIESLVLNTSTFRSGDTVNPSPMLIASVRDDVGLNVSTAGIGHQMTATIDGKTTFNDLNFYFTPSDDGSPAGVINYPFENLSPGAHTLTLRIWDTSGNSVSRNIDFFVMEGLAPKIFDVYTDANPASTAANFYLTHDQPDNMTTVSITVYNLLGRPVWSGSATGRSDMSVTTPVTWNLNDQSGRRVPRGIYLYRATITSDGKTYETASRRIAVTVR